MPKNPIDLKIHYKAAHSTQYVEKALPKALRLYQDIIRDFPKSQEAGYARTQIHNIVRTLVPEEAMLSIYSELILRYHSEKDDDGAGV